MTTPTSGKVAGGTSKTVWGVVVAVIAALGLLGFFGMRGTSVEPEVAVVPPAVTDAAPEPVVEAVIEAPPVAEDTTAVEVASAVEEVASPVEDAPPAEDATAVGEAPFAGDATPVGDAPPDTAQEPAQESLAEIPARIQPSFDVVRLDAEGRAVIAGRAAPGSHVSLRLDGAEIRNTVADRAGNFVAMLQIAPSDRPRVLSLVAVLGDEAPVAGAQTALIAPFTIAAPAVAEAPPADAAQPQAVAAEQAADDVAPADPAAPETAGSAAADAEIAPADGPTILVAGDEGLRVVQGAAGAETSPEGAAALQLEAISYDAQGAVTLAGRGPALADLRVALDDRVVQTAQADAAGQWSLDLSDVAPGTYALRLEQLDATGQVLDVLETPFRREDPTRIRDNPMMADPGSSVITVQRGFTLWGIAEANFGSGFLYVQIFQENLGAIRDPDLIYPGQIFALPDLPRTGSAP